MYNVTDDKDVDFNLGYAQIILYNFSAHSRYLNAPY